MTQAAIPDHPTSARTSVTRSATFLHAVAFVLGFGTVFTLLGSAAGLLGQSLNAYLPTVQRIGAVMLVIFGLVTLGVIQRIITAIQSRPNLAGNPAMIALVDVLGFLNGLMYTERRVTEMHRVKRGWGYLSSALMGVSFSAGWVPCVGPILASILFLASDSATAGQGALLLAIYSLGLGIPFLLTGAAFSQATSFLRRLNRHANIVSIVSGIFLLYVAWLLWSDQMASLTTQFAFLNELVFDIEDWITATFGVSAAFSSGVLGAAPLALLAGVISFISPCVLPLIPAYIGYLSGASLSNSRV
ncbi:MAG: cytochrome c biogenesis protein CcdA [Caldilineaceae bacterium]|nr:cytochrome c biogenesis protein CcdA [Caldilineaceae bacterium]HRJ43877.1 cytochrome c biogenesis protein CcdA [Caldilineaceae bacterium]